MSLRSSIKALCLGYCGTLCLFMGVSRGSAAETSAPYRVYVGTYTQGSSEGIYRFEFDPTTGKSTAPVLAAKSINPSFLAFSPSQEFLYAVNEVDDPIENKPYAKTGWVTAFRVDPATGELHELNKQSSGGAIPCYVLIDSKSKNALVANYSGGSVACIPLLPDGSLGSQTHEVKHGKSPEEKAASRGHSIMLSPDERFAIAADAGLDKLMIYHFDAEAGLLIPASPATVFIGPKSAPRHFIFHPNKKWAFNNNESNFKINAFDYDAASGQPTMKQTLSTLPAGVEAKGSTAEVLVHPSGKFVYVSNRGPNSIAVFQIDDAGKMTVVEATSTQGKTPRNFRIDPSGEFLLAANQDSGTIVVFRIDQQTGKLTSTGETIRLPNPVCIKFVEPLSP